VNGVATILATLYEEFADIPFAANSVYLTQLVKVQTRGAAYAGSAPH